MFIGFFVFNFFEYRLIVVLVVIGELVWDGGGRFDCFIYCINEMFLKFDILFLLINIIYYVLFIRFFWFYRKNCFVSSFKVRFCKDFFVDDYFRIIGVIWGIGVWMVFVFVKVGVDIIFV